MSEKPNFFGSATPWLPDSLGGLFVYGIFGLSGQSFESFESVDFDLFNHYLLAIVDIDAALSRLAVELATVNGVPRIGTINHEP